MAVVLLMMCARTDAAEAQCHSTDSKSPWSAACFDTHGNLRQVKAEYRNLIVPNASGMAVIFIDDLPELVAVDRHGVVVIPGIRSTGDFDYPDAENGVGRFYASGKCGYFQADTFDVVIPAAYDDCEAFHDGEAAACTGCVRYCTQQDCLTSVFVGGSGVVLDTRGVVLRRFAPPKLEDACGRDGIAEFGQLYGGGTSALKCNDYSNRIVKPGRNER